MMKVQNLLVVLLFGIFFYQGECVQWQVINHAQSTIRSSLGTVFNDEKPMKKLQSWVKSLRACLRSEYDPSAVNCLKDKRLEAVASFIALTDTQTWIDDDFDVFDHDLIQHVLISAARKRLHANTQKHTCTNDEDDEEADNLFIFDGFDHLEKTFANGANLFDKATKKASNAWKKGSDRFNQFMSDQKQDDFFASMKRGDVNKVFTKSAEWLQQAKRESSNIWGKMKEKWQEFDFPDIRKQL